MGLAGFAIGAFVCLHFRLPIPPLFITEMGLLVGGCLGALCALTHSEKKVVPALSSFLGAVLLALGFGVDWLQAAGAALALSVLVWTTVDAPKPDPAAWRDL